MSSILRSKRVYMSKINWVVLVSCNILAAIIFFSWLSTQDVVKEEDGDKRLLFKTEDSFWKRADIAIFKALNGQLKDNKSSQMFWAHSNRRIFDLVSAFSMILIYGIFILRGNTEEKFERIKFGLYMSLCMLVALGSVQVIHAIFDTGRLSPTKVPVEGAIRLSDFDYINFDLKDASKTSFPGDHSAVLFMIATFISFYAKRLYALAAILVALLFVLPRMVGGGHWFTDIFVGGGAITLITASWALCTPLKVKVMNRLNKPGLIFMKIAGKIIPALKPPQEAVS